MHKIRPTVSTFATTTSRFGRISFIKTRGRLIALFILPLVAAALLVSTGVWAKTGNSKKPKREISLRTESRVRRANTKGLVQRKSLGAPTLWCWRAALWTQNSGDGMFLDP